MTTETQSTRAGDGIPAGWFEGPHGAFRANPAFKMDWPPQSLQWQIPLYLAAPAVSAPAWQPIETAPKDMAARLYLTNGITVQGFVDATGQLCVQNERLEWRLMRGKPTHWQPLPAAPRSESMRCAGCDLINGCPEFCRCKPEIPSPVTAQGDQP